MTTPHVLDQLPLWIEGDLAESEMAAIGKHLTECPACREAAESLRSSQAWLREGMAAPFHADDQERLRRKVMDQIRTEAAAQLIPRFKVRPALLVACAASILVASLVWRVEQGRTGQPAVVVIPPAPKAAVLPSLPGPGPIKVEHRTAPLPQARVAPIPNAETESPPQGEPARIEFQTADPNIRIIWLVQAKPPSEPAPIPEEKS